MDAEESGNEDNGFETDAYYTDQEDTAEEDSDAVGNVNFDTSLPTQHSYLGSELHDLRGRIEFEEYAVVRLPVMLSDNIVCPGYTFPLSLEHIAYKEMIKEAVQKDHTFGLIYYMENEQKLPFYGVTMEIYEYEESEQEFKIKAKGRQRFHVVDSSWILRVGVGSANVQILPEIVLSTPLKSIEIDSLNKWRNGVTDESSFKHDERFRSRDAIQTRWPLWIYNYYDENFLMSEIRSVLVNFREILPNDPVKLSYWVIQNLLLSYSERIEALNLNSSIQRLQLVLRFIRKPRVLSCAQCQVDFAGQGDLFAMSKDGFQSNYCNPGGHVHETITVLRAKRINLVGEPNVEYSWFPGYAWTIAQCALCHRHVGWRFTAVKSGLKPSKFYGLTRSSVIIRIRKTNLNITNDF